MKAGIIATTDATFENLDEFDRTVTKDGMEAREVLNLSGRFTDLSGDTIGIHGRLAIEEPVERDSVYVSDEGEIAETQSTELEWQHTDFLIAPGQFVIAGKGGFTENLFRVLEAEAESYINQANLNLRAYLEENEGSTWKMGFYGKEGNANNGVVHGSGVLEDSEVGRLLADHPLNQLGIEFENEGVNYKLFISENGYMEFYEPDDMESAEFITFIEENMMDYIISEDM